MGKPTPTPARTQQSISSFFTKKTVNGVAQSQQSQPSQAPAATPDADSQGDIYNDDTEEDARVPLKSRPNGGGKRTLAAEGGERGIVERPVKRSRGDDDGGSAFFPSSPSSKETSIIAGKSKASSQTERFKYAALGTIAPDETASLEDEDAADRARAKRELLHKKFVKKLGHPDSIAQIKRRNWQIDEDTAALDEEGEGDDGKEETPPPARTKKKGSKTGKLTPLESQILEIKRKHMDTLLIVEIGYKYRFFGEDARIAAKELSIVCIPGKLRYDEHPSEAHLDGFASASIPVHRLPVHAKRLVAAGHKVGVVRQIETAALKKAGDNRNAPFVRKLTNVYTKGTYIDDIDGLDQPTDAPSGGAPATGYLLCITESKAKGWGADEKVDVGILAVQPGTGDIIYDTFEDGFMRNEIETRLLHIAPCEFLVVGELTKATDKLVQHLSGSSMNVFGDKIRVERTGKEKTAAAEAYSHVARFYADKVKTDAQGDNERQHNLLDKVLELSEPVTICLSSMINHLTEYGLEHVFDLTKYFQSFSARSHMVLDGNTLTSLEIYHNQTDHTEKGSLFWSLDKTRTRFGQRLLRKWVGRPLLDRERLEERVAAVEELLEGLQTSKVDKLQNLLHSIRSDLERSLIRIYYGKCTRPELLTVLQTMQRIANEYVHVKSPSDAGFASSLINQAISSLPTISEAVISFLDKISAEAARSNDKYAFFREDEETDAITEHKLGIAAVEHDLDLHRSDAASKLKKKSPVPYVTVAGIEYLIEVPNVDLKNVPASWAKISGTKKLSRFHTPEVVRMLRERDQHKESLSAACDVAFAAFLTQISAHYVPFRDAISSLSTLDCLLSLSTVAAYPGYTKPTFSTSPDAQIRITGGRHPMVETLLSTGYIPNSTALSTTPGSTRTQLITGPNMGGKSSYVRQVALICILAQIGSFVPADAAELGLLDGVYTRMGAHDLIFANQSTFMVELSETAQILRHATPRSLVILDELGRGTSTHDGVAIAHSVLEYVVRDLGCLCLFVTHYQSLASVARSFATGVGGDGSAALENVHMRFSAQEADVEGEEEVTFLYEVGSGVAHRSYGLNVARLARVPKAVIDTAAHKSREMEMDAQSKKLAGLSKFMADVLSNGSMSSDELLEQLVVGVEQL